MAVITEEFPITGSPIIRSVAPSWATPAVQARLLGKIKVGDDCWQWTGGRFASGYGRLKIAGKTCRAHRLTYELFVGPIPEGLVLDHLCRNKLCVRPSHLEPVTDRENILRGEGLASENATKTSCVRGHAYTIENTYWRPTGGRSCKRCVYEAKQRWRQREREVRGRHH